ncbi:MAG TPA: hypothetical protein VJY62_22605 [Bacteroidia bacterium]|nr:hypothetical protein [Bacteroidia bacterium]
MKNIKQILIVTLFLCSIQTKISAQQIYRTLEGTMAITMSYNDTTLIAASHHLVVTLNYETGDISFRVPYESFRTFVDSVDANLLKLSGQMMEFKGKLGIPYINTKKHPPQKFNVEGTILTAVPPANVKAKGTLTHISSGGTIACMLTMKLQFSLEALNIQQAFYNAKDLIQIDIQQAVLKRVND